jgi:small-conductance mechanosensitive channel
MNTSFILQSILLALGFPLLIILLGESVERLKSSNPPLMLALKRTRQYVLPLLAVLLVNHLLALLGFKQENNWLQILESVTGIAIIFTWIALIQALLTVEREPEKKRIHVPNLLFQILYWGLILAIAYYIVSVIWKIDLSKVGISVGIASAAIALALQDTLSNLASGLLLLSAKTFQIGEWIEFEGKQGRVIDQNWWSVTLLDENKRKILIPNGLLAKATINNFGKDPLDRSITVSFSKDDPPDRVIPLLNNLITGIDTIKSAGETVVTSYGDVAIQYELWYLVLPEDAFSASAQLKRRLYYMAQRQGLKAVSNQIPETREDRYQELLDYLSSIRYFSTLDPLRLKKLADQAQFQIYGKGEWITQEGQPNDYFYIIYQGLVVIQVTDLQGQRKIIDRFMAGEVFGVTALYTDQLSQITSIAEDNVELLAIPGKYVLETIQVDSKFASDIAQFIEDRNKSIRFAKGVVEQEDELIKNYY